MLSYAKELQMLDAYTDYPDDGAIQFTNEELKTIHWTKIIYPHSI